MTTRAEWQQLAEDRIRDTRALLAPGVDRWSAAYHLVGYAVECGLKSCVLVRVAAHPEILFQDRRFTQGIWTHALEDLVALAGLKPTRDVAMLANLRFRDYWLEVSHWSEQSRYHQKTQAEAVCLFEAVTDSSEGVMQWIRLYW